jgi:hypothetical protein
MKYFFLILLFTTFLPAQNLHHDNQDPFRSSLSLTEAKKVIMKSFDTIIDLYCSSSTEEKLDFISKLDDFEIEVFMEYLREKYPDEFLSLP